MQTVRTYVLAVLVPHLLEARFSRCRIDRSSSGACSRLGSGASLCRWHSFLRTFHTTVRKRRVIVPTAFRHLGGVERRPAKVPTHGVRFQQPDLHTPSGSKRRRSVPLKTDFIAALDAVLKRSRRVASFVCLRRFRVHWCACQTATSPPSSTGSHETVLGRSGQLPGPSRTSSLGRTGGGAPPPLKIWKVKQCVPANLPHHSWLHVPRVVCGVLDDFV